MAHLYSLPENAFKLIVYADGKEVWRKAIADLHPEIIPIALRSTMFDLW